MFDDIFNDIIANNYTSAYERFFDNYMKQPSQLEYLFGAIIAHILSGNGSEVISILEKEAEVSPLREKISLLIPLYRTSDMSSKSNAFSILLKSCIYLKKCGYKEYAKIFIDTCVVLEPEHRSVLTILGEFAILNKEYSRGLKLFTRAALKH